MPPSYDCFKRPTKINLRQLYLSIRDFIRDFKLHDLSYTFTDINIFCTKSAIFNITTYLHNSHTVSSNFDFLVFIIFYSFHWFCKILKQPHNKKYIMGLPFLTMKSATEFYQIKNILWYHKYFEKTLVFSTSLKSNCYD